MKSTYQQRGTLALSIACLVALFCMFIWKGFGEQSKDIEIAISGAFSICVMAFVKASSDAKNDAQMQKLMDSHTDQVKQMTDGLINSAPAQSQPQPQPQSQLQSQPQVKNT